MAPDGFKINKPGIAKMMREIQREFDRNGPINIPVEADEPGPGVRRGAGNVYHGPVVVSNGDGAQIAFNNEHVTQNQVATKQVAPGFELIAEAVAETLKRLPEVGLAEDERQATEAAANEVLAEITKAEPDRSAVKRGVALMKGFLLGIAGGTTVGAADGAQELAKTAIEQLGSAVF